MKKAANLPGSKNNWLNWCFRYHRAENIWKRNVRAHYFETGVKFHIYRVEEAQQNNISFEKLGNKISCNIYQ